MNYKIIKDFLIADVTDRHWRLREKYIHSSNELLKYYYYCRIRKLENKCNSETGISYHDNSAIFASRPFLPHGLNGIVISRKSVIGKNATILHQVTIGTKITSIKSTSLEDTLAPVIGDNVYIGAGAKIIGNIHIGNNVLIGANAVVTQNIPDDCTVVGCPGKYFKTQNKYK